ncbi:MotE family protein [Campylobacter sp. RM16188]|uniref:MotE family protein n=1 Tax=Campylobacter sp. RM16188 TaxID=1705725 RepID=UPI001555C61D|nr:5'-nucleosidase [Campylobacter sp. RM16188]
MKKILILLLLNLALFGFEVPVDCVSIFESRKAELLKEVEKIDEAKQGLEAFQASSKALFNERNTQLAKKEAEINATLEKIEAKKKDIENLLKRNDEILAELKTMTTDKVSEAYGKMKDQSAADVLSAMDRANAATIMYALAPKKISTIMAKMPPNIASEITLLLQKGPPFMHSESNATSGSESSPEGPAGNLLNF